MTGSEWARHRTHLYSIAQIINGPIPGHGLGAQGRGGGEKRGRNPSLTKKSPAVPLVRLSASNTELPSESKAPELPRSLRLGAARCGITEAENGLKSPEREIRSERPRIPLPSYLRSDCLSGRDIRLSENLNQLFALARAS